LFTSIICYNNLSLQLFTLGFKVSLVLIVFSIPHNFSCIIFHFLSSHAHWAIVPTTCISKSYYLVASRWQKAQRGHLAQRTHAERSLEARLVRRVHSLFTYLGRFAQPSRGLDPPRNPRLRQTLSISLPTRWDPSSNP